MKTAEFKYEMHLHTFPCSKCAHASIEEMVDAAAEHGYAGFVVTNHFYKGNTGIDRELPWQEFVGAYEQDWRRGREYGAKKNIDVLFGIESGFQKGKEILVYGLSPETVKQMPEFATAPLEEITSSIHAHGGMCYYAHPFRAREYIPDPDTEPDITLTDGIEVWNSGNDPDRNDIAARFAETHHLATICGGDVHRAECFGQCAVITDRRIKDDHDLLSVLSTGAYRLSLITKKE